MMFNSQFVSLVWLLIFLRPVPFDALHFSRVLPTLPVHGNIFFFPIMDRSMSAAPRIFPSPHGPQFMEDVFSLKYWSISYPLWAEDKEKGRR